MAGAPESWGPRRPSESLRLVEHQPDLRGRPGYAFDRADHEEPVSFGNGLNEVDHPSAAVYPAL